MDEQRQIMSSGRIAIIGGGPAGLMAAEVLIEAGLGVDVYDAMPSVGRKFLLAGVGGMNITHSEAHEAFMQRYGTRRAALQAMIDAFDATALRHWVHGLGIETFVGSSGRVFPREMKAAPLLRAWLQRLKQRGVLFHVRHRWSGWTEQGALRLQHPHGETLIQPAAAVLALGGGSWSNLGSDGRWVALLQDRGVPIEALQPSNCGFDCAWSEHFRERFAGHPLKTVRASFSSADGASYSQAGECMISEHGIEGSLIYAFSSRLRDEIKARGSATLHLDLLPGYELPRLIAECSHPRGSRSLSSHLQSRVGLKGVKAGLLWERVPPEQRNDPLALAQALKALPLPVLRPRPLDEAISSAGGVPFEALDGGLMLRQLPGVFCAGEMLDWEAPTGGYLLTACLASGRAAGAGVLRWLQS